MTGDGYGLTAGELAGHAARLTGIADKLSQALDAARQVSLGDAAYGVICSFFVPVVHAVTEPGLESLGQAVSAVTSTSAGVRDTATTYDTVEQTNTTPFAGGPS